MARDVTDATFETDVLERSDSVAVVVDLWAPWCGPCRTLGPIIEKVVDETGGTVELATVNVDENPKVSASFQVQSIPAVFAIKDRKIVDQFIGALPEAAVRKFVAGLAPAAGRADQLVELGDETSLREALELEPDHPGAVTSLAEILVAKGEVDDALQLLARIPETGETRRVAALARLGSAPVPDGSVLNARLDLLLESVKSDEVARQELLDLIETMEPDDPRRAHYRRALASRLF